MNKRQIICPVGLILIVFGWVGHLHFESQEKVIRAAIKQHLGFVLDELEAHNDNGRLPAVGVARAILNDEGVEKRVNVTSLFDTKDLWYNPSQPSVGSDADAACALVDERLFSIRANRQVREVHEDYLRQAGFVKLGHTEKMPAPAVK